MNHPAPSIHSLSAEDRIDGMKTGRIVEIDGDGTVRVTWAGNRRGPLAARLSGALAERMGRGGVAENAPVLLLFADGDPEQPVAVDTVETAAAPPEATVFATDAEETVTVDGRRIAFDAREEIVLRCGKSSITLTRAGKIVIRGAYLLNRSSGVNRIKGASVQIN
ncbi:MAG: DUF6484 domain-containing protein [Desulfococcaceae bacterium]